MNFKIRFLFSIIILCLNAELVKSQEDALVIYKHSVNINCRVPSVLTQVKTNTDLRTKKIVVKNDTIRLGVIINTRMMVADKQLTIYPDKTFLGVKSIETEKQVESWKFNGKFSADFKFVERFEVVYTKKVYSKTKDNEKYLSDDIYIHIEFSNFGGNLGVYVYKEGISAVTVDYKRMLYQKGHIEYLVNTEFYKLDEKNWSPGMLLDFR